VPLRPRVGTSLRYDFTIQEPGKKRPKKIKLGNQWALSTREEPRLGAGIIEVRLVTADTRETVGFAQRPQPNVINLTREFLVLRSTTPVDPADPLPNLGVLITSVTLK
jgi:hypothetical protein